MFHRRHVYEHNGGEADAKYIVDSGDNSVRLKQALSETQQSVHQFADLIFPPEQEPTIRKAGMKAHR
jgi:hypothetical protein